MATAGPIRRPFAIETSARAEIQGRVRTLADQITRLGKERVAKTRELEEVEMDLADHIRLRDSYQNVLAETRPE